MYYIYVLYNQENSKIYIGMTNNLERRLCEHNEKKGKHYTARYSGDWIVIYLEQRETKGLASSRERQLKSAKGREFIKKSIPR